MYKKIQEGTDVRKNLIELRQLLKEEKEKERLLEFLDGDFEVFVRLMSDEDAKIRKNAALILGRLDADSEICALYKAYAEEKQMFVRTAYLTAMEALDYRPYIQMFRERMKELTAAQPAPEAMKHVREELAKLRQMVSLLEPEKGHTFTGAEVPSEMMLLMDAGLEQLTWDRLDPKLQERAEVKKGMLRLHACPPGYVENIRTGRELLFMFMRHQPEDGRFETVAKAIMASDVLTYLKRRHQGQGAFHFRIALKTKLVLHEKSNYIKRLASAIEQLSKQQLINSASDYEVEFRIVENRAGKYGVFLKLFTIPDQRFVYRVHTLPTSMQPVRAAGMIAAVRPYLKENAIVLDPFCGVGTLLIERDKVMHARSLYGVDIYGEAIKGGRDNAEIAGTMIYFVNRDCFEFVHEYPFDELITELPSVSGRMTKDMLADIYRRLLERLPEWMQKAGTVILNVTEAAMLKQILRGFNNLEVLAEIELVAPQKKVVFVMKYKEV